MWPSTMCPNCVKKKCVKKVQKYILTYQWIPATQMENYQKYSKIPNKFTYSRGPTDKKKFVLFW